MGRALFFIVLYLATTANAFAYPAIAVGNSGGAVRITASVTDRTDPNAEAAALQAVAQPPQQRVAEDDEDTPPNADDLNDAARAMVGIGQLFAFFNRYWTAFVALATFAAAVVSVSLLCLAISLVSTSPGDVLKERALICAWVAIPAAVSLLLRWTKWPEEFLSMIGVLALLAWCDTFGALIIGRRVRKLISASWKVPAPLSLPLATFAFSSITTVIIFLFWGFDDVSFSSCDSPPYSFLSLCEFQKWQGAYLVALLLLLITAYGAVLPADSNLIRGYNHLATFIRTPLANYRAKRQKRREEAKRGVTEPTAAEPSSYPVPALYSAPEVEAMRLKLKRSQRTSVLGKVIFILDARMELTRDEYGLLRKYRLGNDVIYESSSRQRRKEQTLAHLEMTKGGPGLRDSAGTQLLGAAKSFFWLGRAGVSAATAALSLRVTIDSLISGVHVECKSMNELLEAEAAIREAAQNLRGYLDIAVTFDGREEIVELK
jgi:hypothetical protein